MEAPTVVSEDWNEEDWIVPAAPKAYPTTDVPDIVERKREELLELPSQCAHLIPPDEMAAMDLTRWPLPTLRNSIVTLFQSFDSRKAFSFDAPMDTEEVVRILSTRSIPDPQFLRGCNDAFGQAWFDGRKSIIDLKYPKDRLPFWVLSFWEKIRSATAVKGEWLAALHWVQYEMKMPRKPPTTRSRFMTAQDEVRDAFNVIANNQVLSGLRLTARSFELAHMLGDHMTNDNIVDGMVHILNDRVRSDKLLAPTVIVATVGAGDELRRIVGATDTGSNLSKFEIAVKESGRQRIYFPVNIRNQHWIVILVDFLQRTFSYGDSLDNVGRDDKIMRGLERWLKRFPGERPFKEGNALECGEQNDAVSCAYCMVNAIERSLWKDALWTVEFKRVYRADWFNKLARYQAESILARRHSLRSLLDQANNSSVLQSRGAPTSRPSRTEPPSVRTSAIAKSAPAQSNPVAVPSAAKHSTRAILDSGPEGPVTASSPDKSTSIPPSNLPNKAGHGYERAGKDEGRSDGEIEIDSLPLVPPRDADTLSSADGMSVDASEFERPSSGDDVGMDSVHSDGYSLPDMDDLALQPGDVGFRSAPPSAPSLASSSENGWDGPREAELFVNLSHPPSASAQASGVKRKRSTSPTESNLSAASIAKSITSGLKKASKSVRAAIAPISTASSGAGPVGISKTSKRTANTKAKARAGELVIDEEKMERFLDKLRVVDPLVIRWPGDLSGKQVRHTKCGKKVTMYQLYEVAGWNDHLNRCTGLNRAGKELSTASTPSIQSFLRPKSQIPVATSNGERVAPNPLVEVPCSGLSPQSNGFTQEQRDKITGYLTRVSVHGAGGVSLQKVADQMYPGTEYGDLSKKQKAKVAASQSADWQWHNFQSVMGELGFVKSVDCVKKFKYPRDQMDSAPPCDECLNLFRLHNFQVALNQSGPKKPENFKFTPKVYRNKPAADLYARYTGLKSIFDAVELDTTGKKTPCLEYAKGVLEGKYLDQPVFTGLVEAMVTRQDKKERGVGMQNMKYTEAFDDFAHTMLLSSPRAYRSFSEHFQARSVRDFQFKQAKEEKFPIGITPATFARAKAYTTRLQYSGPLALSCDDTKLLEGFRLYQSDDGTGQQKWFITGSTDDSPREVANIEELEEVLATGELQKASKLRLWCLQIPLPGVPPLILAARAIANTNSAKDLFPSLRDIVQGLLAQGLNLISYACDGTEVERALERAFQEVATSVEQYKIPHPAPGEEPLVFKIFLYDGHPIATLQDSKHALKTIRNNLFSGARLLILGDYPIFYELIRVLAHDPTGPLFIRDVDNTDKQDDRAATRLASAAALKFLIETEAQDAQRRSSAITESTPSQEQPSRLGVIVYLFVLGELVDAYQNRHIGWVERCQAALRAKFFLELWKRYLDLAQYNKAKHYISREADDILEILINGLITLVIIHRDYLGDDSYPLLPWFHSSEPCEHTFGLARQITADFTCADFFLMVNKLSIQLKSVIKKDASASSAKTASGYHITCYDPKDINLSNLASFPTDHQFQELAKVAYAEAEALWIILGVPPVLLNDPGLPDRLAYWADEEDSDEESGADLDGGLELQELLEQGDALLESRTRVSRDDQDLVEACTSAAIAVSVDTSHRIMAMSDYSDHDLEEDLRTVASALSDAQTGVPNHQVPAPALTVEDLESNHPDLSMLAEIRSKHQTRYAERGIRRFGKETPDEGNLFAPAPSTQKKLVQKMHQVFRRYDQAQGIATGLPRKVRTETKSADPKPKPGNQANAEAAATSVANAVLQKRRKAFAGAGVHLSGLLANANVDAATPLSSGAFAFVLVDSKISVARVLTIYSKGGGKGGKHSWVKETPAISKVSYIGVQLFENLLGTTFRARYGPRAHLQVGSFAHLPAAAFLYMFPPSGADSRVEIGIGRDLGKIKITTGSLNTFYQLVGQLGKIKEAFSDMTKRKRKKKGDDEESEPEGLSGEEN